MRCETAVSECEWQFFEGYRDGYERDAPKPSGNRHPAYLHSWEIGRAEREGRVIPAAFSRKRAAHIEAGGDFYPFQPTQEDK